MHILVSTTTASDLAETAEQSIDYLQKIVDYMISKAHILISALTYCCNCMWSRNLLLYHEK